MKKYCIVEDGVIQNIIVVDDSFRISDNMKIAFDWSMIGDLYDTLAFDERKKAKHLELSEKCQEVITSGIDVINENGNNEHFSLTQNDQINLSYAFDAVNSGMNSFLYHADGELCRQFSANEIKNISKAATQHKLYNTTYCNHLFIVVERAKNRKELSEIYYGMDLPEDLQKNMDELLNNEK